MGTNIRIVLYAEDSLKASGVARTTFDLIGRLENIMSHLYSEQ